MCSGRSFSHPNTSCLHKKYRKYFTLFTCDTALSPLLCADIVPDVCVALESQYYNVQDFIPPFFTNTPSVKDITLYCDITSYPPVNKLYSRKHFFSTEFAPLSFFRRNTFLKHAMIPPLGSVGLQTLSFALQSLKNICILSGLDFAFLKGKSHCIHSPSYHTLLHTSHRLHPISNIKDFLSTTLYEASTRTPSNNDATSFPKKVTDSVLFSYAQQCNELLKKTPATPYEINTESMLNNTQQISIENFICLLQHSNSPPPRLHGKAYIYPLQRYKIFLLKNYIMHKQQLAL